MTNDHLRPLIRSLKVRFDNSISENSSFCKPWFLHLPAFIVENLPRLCRLEIISLGDFDESQVDTQDFFSTLQRITTIKSLTLNHCCIPYHALNGFVTSLSGLETLHCHDHWLDGNEAFDLHTIPPIPKEQIPSLKIFYYHNDRAMGPTTRAFIKWLSPVSTLKTVGLHIDEEKSLRTAGKFLCRLGENLEHLELRFLDEVGDWGWDNGCPEHRM